MEVHLLLREGVLLALPQRGGSIRHASAPGKVIRPLRRSSLQSMLTEAGPHPALVRSGRDAHRMLDPTMEVQCRLWRGAGLQEVLPPPHAFAVKHLLLEGTLAIVQLHDPP